VNAFCKGLQQSEYQIKKYISINGEVWLIYSAAYYSFSVGNKTFELEVQLEIDFSNLNII